MSNFVFAKYKKSTQFQSLVEQHLKYIFIGVYSNFAFSTSVKNYIISTTLLIR